jgi:CheY-like chemotaxis protein
MTSRIGNIIAALRAEGMNLTSEEVADMLWLAAIMSGPQGDLNADQDGSSAPSSVTKNLSENDHGLDTTCRPLELDPAPAEPRSVNVYAQGRGSDDGARSLGALPFRSPTATALPGALEIARALRPLMRRVPSRTMFILDEEATAQRIAEEQVWTLQLRRAPARWFEFALVVDESASMAIWHQTIAELRRLLERHGAFRDVRTWGLSANAEDGALELRASIGAAARAQPPRSPRELIDPAGRRLIVIISDCLAPEWYSDSGKWAQLLEKWARSGPVALIQVLPQRLWPRSALGQSSAAMLSTPSPGAPTAQLLSDASARKFGRAAAAERLKLPIITLDAESVEMWARLVAGLGGATAPGRLLRVPTHAATSLPQAAPLPNSGTERDAAQRVNEFFSTASDAACRLTELLASMPLNLPVMRLVQQTMLPDASQAHLAEVYLSGLLQSTTRTPDLAHPDEVQYDFLPGVREYLIAHTPMSKSLDVLRRISAYIANEPGQSDFMALLEAPNVPSDITIAAGSQPFASVAASVLRRFGGKYADLAQRLSDPTARQSTSSKGRDGNAQTSAAPGVEPLAGDSLAHLAGQQPKSQPSQPRKKSPARAQARAGTRRIATAIGQLQKKLAAAERTQTLIRRNLRNKAPTYTRDDLADVEREIADCKHRIEKLENELADLDQRAAELSGQQPRTAHDTPSPPPTTQHPSTPKAETISKIDAVASPAEQPSAPGEKTSTQETAQSSVLAGTAASAAIDTRVLNCWIKGVRPGQPLTLNTAYELNFDLGTIRADSLGVLEGISEALQKGTSSSEIFSTLIVIEPVSFTLYGVDSLELITPTAIGMPSKNSITFTIEPKETGIIMLQAISYINGTRFGRIRVIVQVEPIQSASPPPAPTVTEDTRVINCWIEGVQADQSLSLDKPYQLKFDIGAKRNDAIATISGIGHALREAANDRSEPQVATLLVVLDPGDFTLYGFDSLDIVIPKAANAPAKNSVAATIEAKKVGQHKLNAIFYIDGHLFQRTELKLQVGEQLHADNSGRGEPAQPAVLSIEAAIDPNTQANEHAARAEIGTILYESSSNSESFSTWGRYSSVGDPARRIAIVHRISDRRECSGLEAISDEFVGINKVVEALQGWVEFEYYVVNSATERPNVVFYVIPMQRAEGLIEVGANVQDDPKNPFSPYRRKYIVPEAHMRDLAWHTTRIDYDFRSIPTAAYSIFGPRLNEGCPEVGPAQLLVTNVRIYTLADQAPRKTEPAANISPSARLRQAHILWVDDRPNNNIVERRQMENLGIEFTLSTSTEDALTKVRAQSFDAIISDMGRPPDYQAGYTLLEALHREGIKLPYIIYAGSRAPEHQAETLRRGGFGTTNSRQELFQMVMDAIGGNIP